jgi:hypothetical protein
MTWSKEVHTRPTRAPSHFAELPPAVRFSAARALVVEYHGSGFQPADVLGQQTGPHTAMNECGACGSTDTRAIYLKYFHHMVESEVIVELVCAVCGKFTVHLFERL